MDLQNQLIRRTITIAVNRAIENMQSSPERSSRNLLDLGLFFTKSHRLRHFYETAKNILSNPKNSYHQLIKRVIETVDLETVKNVSINLGFNSLNYGTKILRKSQQNMEYIVPWLLAFQIDEYSLTFFEQIRNHIADGQELGIYSYIFILESAEALSAIISIAEHYSDCVFMLIASPQLLTNDFATLLSKPKNIVISVKLEENLADKETCLDVFQQLRTYKCLYGFQIRFSKNNAAQISSEDFLCTMLSHGCAYGSYLADPENDEQCNEQLKYFVDSERYGHGQPILAFDWFHDTNYVGKAVLPGSDYLILNAKNEASLGHKPDKQQTTGSLNDIIQAIMPRRIQYAN